MLPKCKSNGAGNSDMPKRNHKNASLSLNKKKKKKKKKKFMTW